METHQNPYRLEPWRPELSGVWDAFLAEHPAATFIHSRRFLAYHQDRFEDVSLAVFCGEKLVGVFNAALHPADRSLVVSHPGSTFGGLLVSEQLQPGQVFLVLKAICVHYRDCYGAKKLTYKAVPQIFHRRPYQIDLSCLFRLDARLVNLDLCSTIDLSERSAVSQRRRRSLKKARSGQLQLSSDLCYLPEFWRILDANLRQRYGVAPVHTIDEIVLLTQLFQETIKLSVALLNGTVVAGIVFFDFGLTLHTQYVAAGAVGRKMSALDLIIESAIAEAGNLGKRYFNFGISTENGGYAVNESLYQFKMEFGSGSTAYQTFELNLV
jgi:hypothetical protein